MITALLFIVVLSVLVFVHELGHFLAAKAAGMGVEEFGIGFPPRLISWGGKGENSTRYSLNLLLFGGFVKIQGENGDEDAVPDPRSFGSRPKYWQIIVLVAGICGNIIFAWLLTSSGFVYGLPVSADTDTSRLTNIHVVLTEIIPGAPADVAGLKPGDRIDLMETKDDALTPETSQDVISFIDKHVSEPITIHYERLNTEGSAVVTAKTGVIADAPQEAAIGVGIDAVGTLKLGVLGALVEGAKSTWYTIITIATGLGALIAGLFAGTASLKDVSGPIGIAKLVGDARDLGVGYFISFVSFISINLAIINILPFPALDGGRVLFVLIETVTRRRISARVTAIANTTGFLLLVLLMLIVTYHDIAVLFTK